MDMVRAACSLSAALLAVIMLCSSCQNARLMGTRGPSSIDSRTGTDVAEPKMSPGAGEQGIGAGANVVKPLMVMLSVKSGDTKTVGAGIIAGFDAQALYVVTADHVAFSDPFEPDRKPDEIVARFWLRPGSTRDVEAQVLPTRDRERDLAVLRVPMDADLRAFVETLPFARTRTPEALRRQQEINTLATRLNDLGTIGNPLGVGWFTTDADRFLKPEGDDIRFASSWLMIGHSGGGLFTQDWHLVGMIKTHDPPAGVALGLDRIVATLRDWKIPVALELHPIPPANPKIFKDCAHCPEMVEVPAGRFVMGEELDRRRREPNEDPAHEVVLTRAFAMGRYEVTLGEYRAFVAATGDEPAGGCKVWKNGIRDDDGSKNWLDPGYPTDDRQPVVCINWDEAEAYTKWLSKTTGKRYRLPTEAEWEYTARSGGATRFWWGDHFVAGQANCRDCGSDWDDERAAPVGQFVPNYFGVYDMHGNVQEWVEDCWHDTYVGAPADGSAWQNDGGCKHRVKRGGTWNEPKDDIRSGNRNKDGTDSHTNALGFRVARDL
jgi:formylglycine-generating enzyme required for sulfatase activity